jgi:hypothetical protein
MSPANHEGRIGGRRLPGGFSGARVSVLSLVFIEPSERDELNRPDEPGFRYEKSVLFSRGPHQSMLRLDPNHAH